MATFQKSMARHGAWAAVLALSALGLLPTGASAVECVKGVYRAGCAGPNGAVGVAKPPAQHPVGTVKCADGVYRTACKTSNGAAVVRKRY